jgi:hypothetical protein
MASETNGAEALVKTRALNWKELVMKQWGKEWAKPEQRSQVRGPEERRAV